MRNAGVGVDGLDGSDVLTADHPAEDAFSTYKVGRAVFRIALGVIIGAGLCYLAATWIWATTPSRSAPSAPERTRAACLMTRDCQPPWWPGYKNCAPYQRPGLRRPPNAERPPAALSEDS